MGLFGDDETARRRDAVRSTSPTRAAAVQTDADVVAVEGVVRVHEETLTVPLADAAVVEAPADGGSDADDQVRDTQGGDRREGDGPDAPAASSGGDDPGDEDGPDRPGPSGRASFDQSDDDTGGEPEDDGDGPAATDGGTTLDDRAAGRAADDRGPAVVTTYVKRPRGSTAPARRRVEAVPFVVEDDSGRVLVDATEAPAEAVLVSPGHTERLLGDESGSRLVRASDTGLDSTREVARARTALGTTPDWEHERGALRAGDRVYVLGRPRSSGEEEPATVLAADADAPFAVSDLSRSALAEQLQRQAGGLDRRFWLFAVVGGIAAIILLITVAVFLDSFVLTTGG